MSRQQHDPYGYSGPGSSSGHGGQLYPANASQAHSTDAFAPQDYNGMDHAGLRERNTYPPTQGMKDEDDYAYGGGRGANGEVTRGSIAAQMAAEGQIPKKEGLRMWRSDEHRGALMKGGRGKCCGRVCCCSILLAIILFVGIVAAFFLWVKPPSVTFNGIEGPASGSEVSLINNGFSLNVRLNIGVVNPNFFGATFPDIQVTTYYSTAPTKALGGGELKNSKIPKNSNSTIHFPLTVNYTTAIDSNFSIITDIATKCGFVGNAASDLTVDYTVKLKAKVIVVTIPVTFSSTVSFACPVSQDEIESALGVSSLSDLVGSLTKRTLGEAEEYGAESELVRRRREQELVADLARRGTTYQQEAAMAHVMSKVMQRALETRSSMLVIDSVGAQ